MKIKQKAINITRYDNGSNYCLLIRDFSQTTDKISWIIILNGYFYCKRAKKSDAIKEINGLLAKELPDGEILSIGAKIRIMRLHRDLTQGELAGKSGTSQKVISRIELDLEDPSSKLIKKIQNSLQIKFYL